MDIFQISSSLTFFICKTIDCCFPVFNNSSMLCCPVHSLLWITLLFPFSVSAISSLPTVSQGLFFFFYFFISLEDNLICTRVSITIYFLMIHNYLFPFQISLTSGSEFLLTYSALLGYLQGTSNLSCSKLFSCTSSLFFKPGPLLPLPISVSHHHPWNVLLLPTNPYHSWWWLINHPGVLIWLPNTLSVCFILHLDCPSSGYFALLLEHLEASHSTVQI